MNTLNAIPIVKVWLESDQRVSTANLLIEGYRIPALGVVNSDRQLIGVIRREVAAASSPDVLLRDVALERPTPIEQSSNIREVAKYMVQKHLDYIPIVENGKFLGIATALNMISKLRQSYDPMTGLPWSDALREWGLTKLEQGVEIAILFVDLNHFGKFNKDYGHVVGDKVLKRLVEHLSANVDPDQDVLVRYGGDEFAIGTTRERESAEALRSKLIGDGSGLHIPESPVPIFFSIGMFGGRRSKPRSNVHFPSNIDDLVNMASRDCQANKSGETKLPQAISQNRWSEEFADRSFNDGSEESENSQSVVESPINPNPILETIQVDDDETSLTYVVIRVLDHQYVGVGLKMGQTEAESVAMATAKALERAYASASVVIQSLKVVTAGSTELVQIKTRVTKDGIEHEIEAEGEANGDLHTTIASAVISAFSAV